jgi:hypothetical protein
VVGIVGSRKRLVLRPNPARRVPLKKEKYWTAASHAESLIALGDKSGPDLLKNVIGSAPAKWMADVTLKQLDKVQTLLAGLQQTK